MVGSLIAGDGRRSVRRRTAGVVLALAVAGAAAASLWFARFDHTFDQMLPPDSPAQRMVAFVQEAGLADTVAVTLAPRGDEVGLDRLLEAADALADALGPPWITRRVTAGPASGLMAGASFFREHAAEILDATDRAEIATWLAPEEVDRRLRQAVRRMMTPEGLFGSGDLQTDPLGIDRLVMQRLAAMAEGAGLEMTMRGGHFVSSDGREVMIVAETPARLTDAAQSRELLAYLSEALANLPPDIEGAVLSGHARTISNEDVIRRDLGVVFGLAAIAFTALFALYFRDARALLVFLVPVVSAVLSLAVVARFFPRLSYLVLGFGPVMAGIAVDYGIFIYVAVRHGRDGAREVRRVARPIVGAALTTGAIFAAFLVARVPVYHQLSAFALLSVALSLVLAIGVLPRLLRPGPASAAVDRPVMPPKVFRADLGVAAAFLMFLVLAAVYASRAHLDADVTGLDGTDPAVLAQEERFQSVWGGSGAREAILGVAAADEDAARAAADRIHAAVASDHGAGALSGLSTIWPARATRAGNLEAWQMFWTEERVASLRDALATAGARHGFKPDAFAPFFARLRGPPEAAPDPLDNPLFTILRDRFIRPRDGVVRAFSYFRDTPELRRAVADAARETPGAAVFSRTALTEALRVTFEKEMLRLAAASGVLILLCAGLFLRSLRGLVAAMAPAAGGALGVVGLMGARGVPLNLANLMAGIVVVGLCIDFGIHRLHAWRHGGVRTTRSAITLGAATTLIGAGALLFARHPALYAIGWTLSVGVSIGYVVAMAVVPALCRLLFRAAPVGPAPRGAAGRTAIAGILLPAMFAGCATWRPLPADAPEAALPGADLPASFESVSSVVFRFRPRWWLPAMSVTGIGYASVDRDAGTFRVVGLTPMGVTLFDVGRTDGQLEGRIPIPALPDREIIARRIGEDIAAIYLDPFPESDADAARRGGTIRFRSETDDGLTEIRVDAAEGWPVERRDFEGRRRVRTVHFEDYRHVGGAWHPGTIRLHNRRGGYRLVLRLREIADPPGAVSRPPEAPADTRQGPLP